MCDLKFWRIWELSYGEYNASGQFQSPVQQKASHAIMNCKSGRLGANHSQCPDCGHLQFHNNSCRTPGIIQVLHTWEQEIRYHVHMHCIISGGGLTPGHKMRKAKKNFFIPIRVLRNKFKGKYLADFDSFYKNGQLEFSASCQKLRNSYQWAEFRNGLYKKDRCPFIKETFNGFGNAIEYLGRYTHKVAIANSRILSVDEQQVTFSARGRNAGEPRRTVTLENTEFIRRYLMHVLPPGFQKIRYYGFLNNRGKSRNEEPVCPPDNAGSSLNTVFLRPPQEGLRSMPFYKSSSRISVYSAFQTVKHPVSLCHFD